MEFELSKEPKIVYSKGIVKFESFDNFKMQAQSIADYINSITLTEYNVAEVKKNLANARKVVNALEDKRKAIKKEVLKDYVEFEAQMKELVSIVDSADNTLRSQIRALEEQEREDKKRALFQLWCDRCEFYTLNCIKAEIFDTVLDVLGQKMLNKTESMNKCEKAMVEFLERTEKELRVIESMQWSSEIRQEYFNDFDLARAVERVNNNHRIADVVIKDAPPVDEVARFVITGAKDIKLVELLLHENNIPFKKF